LEYLALDQKYFTLVMMPSRDLDATCYGDSGGGRFIKQNGEWVLVGLTSWGDVPCVATDKVARLDTASALNFLNNVLATFESDDTCD
jgi:secreted trypsin-like serine protease